tara:strand:- start:441 stop:851 length:411 start_codon:yes stop_codon:yes gene_type:complete
MNNLALLLLRVIFSVSLITHVPAKITKLVDGRWDIHFPLSFDQSFHQNLVDLFSTSFLPILLLAIFSELIAPILIILGFRTKFFSFFPAATMFVVVCIVKINGNWHDDIELPLLYLFGFVTIFFCGPGKYSIDRKF